nr:hypothetical protein [Amaricoccus solimangrovi]
MQQVFELAFQLVALDRLAVARAPLRWAEIVGILLALALRPAGSERLAAVVAQDEPAQREVRADVLAGSRLGRAFQAGLNPFEGFEADQRLVVALAQPHAPIWSFEIPGIDRAGQKVVDALIAYLAVRKVLREGRLALKEALDLDLCREAPRGVAFKRLLKDGSVGLVTDQNSAVTAGALVSVADRSLKNPIAVLHPRSHAVDGLLAVLLALVLRHRGQQVLDQPRVRAFAEFDGGADENTASVADLHAQIEMRHQIARKAADIVDNDGMRLFAARLQVRQHGLHAGSCRQASGSIVPEDLDDLIAAILGKFPASRFL